MSENKNRIYYPLLLNLQKFPCLVIGGGDVAYRKVLSLLDFHAAVTVLSPKFCDEIIALKNENRISITKDYYSKKFLEGFKIVFCATNNSAVNQQVQKDCYETGKILNVVDIPELCDFIVPANIKRGELTVSISSQGAAPFYTKEVKKKLQKFLSAQLSDVIELAGYFRKKIIENVISTEIKNNAFKRFVEIDWEKLLNEKGKEAAYLELEKILNEFY
jgi:precorrin-2 dehydrogenase/sirohydrochlorin ferrochelatase